MEPENHKKRLLVSAERASDGIWEIDEGYHGVDGLNLPDWMINKIVFWSDWYEGFFPQFDHYAKQTRPGRTDFLPFRAYTISIAIDLQITLGDDFEVYYHGENDEYIKAECSNSKWSPRGWSR